MAKEPRLTKAQIKEQAGREWPADRLKIIALHLLRTWYPAADLACEIALASWGAAKIDVAAFIPGVGIHGVEVKGGADTLDRLDRQWLAYSGTAQRLSLLVAPNHRVPPSDWNLFTATDDDWLCAAGSVADGREWSNHCYGTCHRLNRPADLWGLLWSRECKRAADTIRLRGLELGRNQPVSEHVPMAMLREIVMDLVFSRRGLTPDGFRRARYWHPEEALPTDVDGLRGTGRVQAEVAP